MTARELIGLILLVVSVYGAGVLFGVLLAGRSHARSSKAYRFVIYASGVVFAIGTFVGAEMVIA